MESAAQALSHAHELYTRSGGAVAGAAERPPAFKAIGIGLAVGSGAFIGTSFVLKKVGLLKANEKYNEVAGEGYGYLKNFYWWAGMILMIIGEGLNFAAYAFTDAILVTPLGALSVVLTTILSAIFLKERLSMVGKVACFLCIVGSVVIVMNAPTSSSVSNIQEMQGYVIHPAFLTYAGVVIVGSAIVAFWLGPKYGNKNMLVYISICSWVGGLSVVATQGLGAAIIAQAGGTPQFNQWFLYVLLVFVIGTLLTEIIFLNKALNLFNAALVTPTYYVYFTSTTIISSAILFRGFKGTPTSIITVVNGFLTICAGVVLLQLSKSAKDVPDAAVFNGDLDQIHTIAEQPQPETEPKADAIRGAAAIVRRLSSARQKMELDELKRMREEKLQESLEPVTENGAPPQYEWDGIRRRRTGTFSTHRSGTPAPTHLAPPTPHLPLGWSHFPTEEELAEANRPVSPALSSIVGTIRTRARSVLLPGHPDFRSKSPDPKVQSPMHPVQLTSIAVPGSKPSSADDYTTTPPGTAAGASSTRRVQFGGHPSRQVSDVSDDSSAVSRLPPTPPPHATARRQFSFHSMFKRGQFHAAHSRTGSTDTPADHHHHARPTSSRQGISSRGYSSPQIRGATEEETLGLVKGDSNSSGNDAHLNTNRSSRSMPALGRYDETDDDEDDDVSDDEDDKYPVVRGEKYRDDDDVDDVEDDRQRPPATAMYGHSITRGYTAAPQQGGSPPRTRTWRRDSSGGGQGEKGVGLGLGDGDEEEEEYERSRRRFEERRGSGGGGRDLRGSGEGSREGEGPPPPPHGGTYRGRSGGFI
ncbi:magnesium transporter NIPA-domain-containing protein [Parachaetomium inaequale]|uniref:Magnesium transporter NIPA-domain-containing protein n=1 Tax=Parachaetomium inaequale TaxID=2588326 RepID=A0AAN6PNJ1_9PEZI|nr:magnesium transporter NIPA-domain-containing protein [Parachaetomium inaequale]